MAKIKAYTDLKQSESLAIILPLESADMYYDTADKEIAIPFIPDNVFTCILGKVLSGSIAAWSLAALLDVLPKNLKMGRPSLNSNYKGYYWVQYYDEYMKPTKYTTKCYNNPIDACYEMVLKLHELKLL